MPNLKVQMNLYARRIMGGELGTLLRRYIVQIGHIQVVGFTDRHELNKGELNVRHRFAWLDQLGGTEGSASSSA